MTHPQQVFAVIPAAGLSRRMGEPKLLMQVGESTVIERLLMVLQAAGVNQTVVVCRKTDHAIQHLLKHTDAKIVMPNVDPSDMRQSVQYALDHIRVDLSPANSDGWMLIPADHPVLTVATVSRLIAEWKTSAAPIVVPVHQTKRGHPTLFGWQLVQQIPLIPADRGLNQLLKDERNTIHEVDVDDPTVLFDLDTPEDYQRMLGLLTD